MNRTEWIQLFQEWKGRPRLFDPSNVLVYPEDQNAYESFLSSGGESDSPVAKLFFTRDWYQAIIEKTLRPFSRSLNEHQRKTLPSQLDVVFQRERPALSTIFDMYNINPKFRDGITSNITALTKTPPSVVFKVETSESQGGPPEAPAFEGPPGPPEAPAFAGPPEAPPFGGPLGPPGPPEAPPKNPPDSDIFKQMLSSLKPIASKSKPPKTTASQDNIERRRNVRKERYEMEKKQTQKRGTWLPDVLDSGGNSESFASVNEILTKQPNSYYKLGQMFLHKMWNAFYPGEINLSTVFTELNSYKKLPESYHKMVPDFLQQEQKEHDVITFSLSEHIPISNVSKNEPTKDIQVTLYPSLMVPSDTFTRYQPNYITRTEELEQAQERKQLESPPPNNTLMPEEIQAKMMYVDAYKLLANTQKAAFFLHATGIYAFQVPPSPKDICGDPRRFILEQTIIPEITVFPSIDRLEQLFTIPYAEQIANQNALDRSTEWYQQCLTEMTPIVQQIRDDENYDRAWVPLALHFYSLVRNCIETVELDPPCGFGDGEDRTIIFRFDPRLAHMTLPSRIKEIFFDDKQVSPQMVNGKLQCTAPELPDDVSSVQVKLVAGSDDNKISCQILTTFHITTTECNTRWTTQSLLKCFDSPETWTQTSIQHLVQEDTFLYATRMIALKSMCKYGMKNFQSMLTVNDFKVNYSDMMEQIQLDVKSFMELVMQFFYEQFLMPVPIVSKAGGIITLPVMSDVPTTLKNQRQDYLKRLYYACVTPDTTIKSQKTLWTEFKNRFVGTMPEEKLAHSQFPRPSLLGLLRLFLQKFLKKPLSLEKDEDLHIIITHLIDYTKDKMSASKYWQLVWEYLNNESTDAKTWKDNIETKSSEWNIPKDELGVLLTSAQAVPRRDVPPRTPMFPDPKSFLTKIQRVQPEINRFIRAYQFLHEDMKNIYNLYEEEGKKAKGQFYAGAARRKRMVELSHRQTFYEEKTHPAFVRYDEYCKNLQLSDEQKENKRLYAKHKFAEKYKDQTMSAQMEAKIEDLLNHTEVTRTYKDEESFHNEYRKRYLYNQNVDELTQQCEIVMSNIDKQLEDIVFFNEVEDEKRRWKEEDEKTFQFYALDQHAKAKIDEIRKMYPDPTIAFYQYAQWVQQEVNKKYPLTTPTPSFLKQWQSNKSYNYESANYARSDAYFFPETPEEKETTVAETCQAQLEVLKTYVQTESEREGLSGKTYNLASDIMRRLFQERPDWENLLNQSDLQQNFNEIVKIKTDALNQAKSKLEESLWQSVHSLLSTNWTKQEAIELV